MESTQDQAFIAEATRRGLLTPEAIRQALAYGQGREPLPSTLMRVGLLRPGACEGLLTELEQRGFVCRGCKTPLRYAQLANLPSFACPRCGGALKPRDPPSGVAQSLGSGAYAAASPPRSPSSGGHAAVGGQRVLGSYTLLQELGRGCMGVVYKARKSGLRREFALKVMLNARDDEDIERFKQEAQVASKLEHRGIIGVCDVGQSGRHHYYVMDYCAGETLKEKLAQGRLDPREAARLLEQLARTMHYAHSQSVVHRDLKPANIILEQGSGTPRVTDFGLAKDYARLRSLTQSGDILGTPYYMAPEQFRGKGIDARTDVWALGVILYECLTGKRPFAGKDHRELSKKVRKPPTPPSEIVRDLPADIEAICSCAMARDKNDRYLNAEALAEDLAAFLRGDTPSHASGVVGPNAERRRWIKAVALTLVLSSVASAGVVGALTIRERAAEREQRAARAKALAEQERIELALSERRSAARAALEGARAIEKDGGPIERVLEALGKAEANAPTDSDTAWKAVLARADVLVRRGQPAAAIECAAQARLQPDAIGWEAIRIVAEAQEKLGRCEDAKQTYSELRAVNSGGARGLTAAAARKRMEGSLANARALAARALRREPNYRPALFELLFATITPAGQRAPSARDLAALTRARQVGPPSPRLVYCEAILASAASPEEGLRLLNEAIALCNGQPEPLLLRSRGGLAATRGDLDSALADLDAAIAIDPSSVDSYALRAQLRWRKSKDEWHDPRWLELFEADLRKAQGMNSRTLGALLDSWGEAFAREARALLSGTPRDPLDFGLTLRLHRRLAERARRAQRLGRAPLLRALLRAAMGGGWEEVKPLYAAAAQAAPDCATIAIERARIAVGREDFKLGKTEIDRARRLGAPELDLDILLALLYWQSGKGYIAAPRFEALVRRDGQGIVGLSARAWWLHAHDEEAKALIAARRAVEFDPEHVPSLVINSLLLLQEGQEDFDEADALLKRAVTLEGALDCRTIRGLLDVRTKRLFADAAAAKTLSPEPIAKLLDQYAQVMPLSGGTGLLLDAVQLLVALPPGHPWQRECTDWIAEALRRDPDLGMTYVLQGLQRMRSGAGKAKVLESWKKARQVEPRIQISDWRLEVYRQMYPGPCPELKEFEPH